MDREASKAAKMEQEGVHCSFACMKRRLRTVERRKVWKHPRCAKVYGPGAVNIKLEDSWTREQMVSLARLRSGHTNELAAYRKRINAEEDALCPRCGEEEENTEHLLKCTAGEMMRRECGVEQIEHLVSRPVESLRFWKWWKKERQRTKL